MRKLLFKNSREETITLGYCEPYLINEIDGLGEVDADVYTNEAPYMDGASFIDVTLDTREIDIEGTFRELNKKELYKNRKYLQKVFNPKLGLGTLRFEDEDVVREIKAVADGTPVYADKGKDVFQKFQINLLCPDPYWEDIKDVSRRLTAYKGIFKLPFTLPFKLGKQGDRTTLFNDGDIEAPVKIDIHGPVTNPQVRNATTGEFIKINTSIAGDEILHIETNPRSKRIEIFSNGIVRSGFGFLDFANGAKFWKLVPGENEIEFYADSGGNDGKVAVSWRNQYTGI